MVLEILLQLVHHKVILVVLVQVKFLVEHLVEVVEQLLQVQMHLLVM